MRIMMFLKLIVLSLCISLLIFALLPGIPIMSAVKAMALGTVLSIAITACYPEMRGVKIGDTVAVVTSSAIPGVLGRIGKAAAHARKNEQIKIILQNGSEVLGIVESYTGLISHAKIRVLYEERLVD